MKVSIKIHLKLPQIHIESEVAQSCPTLCYPMDCSLPGSSLHGILQARVLEWVAISFSRGSSRPRDRTQVSHIGGRHFNLSATREAPASSLWKNFNLLGILQVPNNKFNQRNEEIQKQKETVKQDKIIMV